MTAEIQSLYFELELAESLLTKKGKLKHRDKMRATIAPEGDVAVLQAKLASAKTALTIPGLEEYTTAPRHFPSRNGKPLTKLPKGDKRRLSDGRNAWRKMTPEQRKEFLAWIKQEGLKVA